MTNEVNIHFSAVENDPLMTDEKIERLADELFMLAEARRKKKEEEDEPLEDPMDEVQRDTQASIDDMNREYAEAKHQPIF